MLTSFMPSLRSPYDQSVQQANQWYIGQSPVECLERVSYVMIIRNTNTSENHCHDDKICQLQAIKKIHLHIHIGLAYKKYDQYNDTSYANYNIMNWAA